MDFKIIGLDLSNPSNIILFVCVVVALTIACCIGDKMAEGGGK